METQTVKFDPRDFNSKIRNLESNGFEEYLSVNEHGVTHVIMTNTKIGSEWDGIVADIYSDGRINYSSQFPKTEINEPSDPEIGHADYLKKSGQLKSFDIKEV